LDRRKLLYYLLIPYDGKDLGTYKQDEQQPIIGYFEIPSWSGTGNPVMSFDGKLFKLVSSNRSTAGITFGDNRVISHVAFNSAEVVRTGSTNKPPSISISLYITY